MEEDIFSLEGPVDEINGQLVSLIPLAAGGDKFIECSRGISEVHGEYVKIIIPEWLAGTLRIAKGQRVSVDNKNGKFNIQPIDPTPLQ